MQKLLARIRLLIYIRNTFRKYKHSLPTTSDYKNPKIDYHVLADGIVWEDEGIESCHSDLENAFRYVLYYRTSLITNERLESEFNVSNKTLIQIFKLAKVYFPNWIGFNESRCSYNSELSHRIDRIRIVSDWKLEKLMNSEEN